MAAVIPFAVGVVLFLLTFPIGNKLSKYCESCHNLLAGCGYEWKVIKQKATGPNAQGDCQFTLKYHLLFTCPHCGKTYTEKVDMISKHGYDDCEIKMQNYCTKRFGH